jgi:hypothetical protein
MFRLETARGVFAIKIVNRDWGNADYVPWYERAFKLELAAYDAGIAMPRPIPVAATGACLPEIDGAPPITCRAHEWVEGEAVRHGEYGDGEARTVGGMIARVHSLNFVPDRSTDFRPITLDPAHWRTLLEKGASAEWRGALAAAMPAVDEMIALASAVPSDAAPIMSHRDSDAKNVLRAKDGRLLLIDWDAAGPIVARHDVAMHALVWGGGYAGEPDATLARAFVAGYRAAGGTFDDPRAEDFAEFLRVMLGWCEFNLRRTLGERLADESHRKIAEDEVRHLLAAFPRFARSPAAWAKMLS